MDGMKEHILSVGIRSIRNSGVWDCERNRGVHLNHSKEKWRKVELLRAPTEAESEWEREYAVNCDRTFVQNPCAVVCRMGILWEANTVRKKLSTTFCLVARHCERSTSRWKMFVHTVQYTLRLRLYRILHEAVFAVCGKGRFVSTDTRFHFNVVNWI